MVRVYASNGVHEDVTYIAKASNANNEWAYVGTYSFSDSTAIVQITDKTSAKLVVAAAIRLVKAE